ncbi:hypothetical protein J6590_041817 [Homalodisca vitripennis]|nr:hypothetical protein J6590_041817 [Homalodisca vitripennis]
MVCETTFVRLHNRLQLPSPAMSLLRYLSCPVLTADMTSCLLYRYRYLHIAVVVCRCLQSTRYVRRYNGLASSASQSNHLETTNSCANKKQKECGVEWSGATERVTAQTRCILRVE